MPLTSARFYLLARLLGVLLALSGTALLVVFLVHLVAGASLLGPSLPLGGPGMLLLATVAAFQVPLGLSLLSRDPRTSSRLRIAAGALGLMALMRLLAFASADMRAVLGLAPLVEFFVLGGLSAVALLIRPAHESPIELMREYEIAAPASAAWELMAARFGDVAEFASGVRSSAMDGPAGVGAVRTCHSEPFGPFNSAEITEELVEFHPEAMRYAYTAGGELPSFIPASRNRWSIESDGPSRCRVRSHVSVELAPWAVPLAPLLGWSIATAVDRFGSDLRRRLESPAAVGVG